MLSLWFTSKFSVLLQILSTIKPNSPANVYCFREMKLQAELGETLEQEWYSKLYSYHNKYPEEAKEFKALLNGGIVPGWESSLPVNYASFLQVCHLTYVLHMKLENNKKETIQIFSYLYS